MPRQPSSRPAVVSAAQAVHCRLLRSLLMIRPSHYWAPLRTLLMLSAPQLPRLSRHWPVETAPVFTLSTVAGDLPLATKLTPLLPWLLPLLLLCSL